MGSGQLVRFEGEEKEIPIARHSAVEDRKESDWRGGRVALERDLARARCSGRTGGGIHGRGFDTGTFHNSERLLSCGEDCDGMDLTLAIISDATRT